MVWDTGQANDLTIAVLANDAAAANRDRRTQLRSDLLHNSDVGSSDVCHGVGSVPGRPVVVGTIEDRPSHEPYSPTHSNRSVVNSIWKSFRLRSPMAAAWRSGASIAPRPWTMSNISRAEFQTVNVEIVLHGRIAAIARV